MRWFAGVLAFCVIVICAPACARTHPNTPTPQGGERVWLQTDHGRLKALAFRSADASAHPRLIVVLHGDSPEGPPSYQYVFAANAAHAMTDVVVAAILRPGYSDPSGDHSDGVHGLTTGDNYTPEVVDAVAQGARQLSQHFAARETILVGHSGGAAIAADIMERHPDVADKALLVSCPCDLTAWRRYMADHHHHNPIWHLPITSLSPIEHVDTLSSRAHLLLLVGSQDDVTPAEFSNSFADAARRHTASAEFTLVPHQPHNMLMTQQVMDALKDFTDR